MSDIAEQPQSTAVCIVQIDVDGGRWRVLLEYEDGDRWMSYATYATEKEAQQAALTWGLENHVPETQPN
jgi:hypothetical protein